MKKKDIMERPCTECGGSLARKLISQEFEREGMRIQLSGVRAWVCTGCNEIYFQPGGADKVAKATNCLFELAMVEKQHKGKLIATAG